jgi:hypothetical protein
MHARPLIRSARKRPWRTGGEDALVRGHPHGLGKTSAEHAWLPASHPLHADAGVDPPDRRRTQALLPEA